MTSSPAPEPPLVASERETLLAFIDHYRSVVRRKAAGLDDAALRRRLEPSTITLGGMLSHLAFVEDYWFGYRLAGAVPQEPWRSADWDADADWDWHRAAEVSGEQLLAEYDAACERSRDIVASIDSLDHPAAKAGETGEAPTLRWILVHMIEELARHAGHADLIREAIDGTVGD